MKRLLSSVRETVLALVFALALACLMTWPAVAHLDEVVIGGGELGGWLWRQWWHFQEVRALQNEGYGLLGEIMTLVSLGRFPETGNILDILLISYPLREWVGSPMDHNLKVIVILVGNGVCGYALARSFTDSVLASLAAAAIAIFNPLVVQDINKTGLRQVLLWWMLLYPIFLVRAGRTCRGIDGAMVGIIFSLISAFYWFYGLFVAMMTVVWLLWWYVEQRPPLQQAFNWISGAAIASVMGVGLFLAPYFSAGSEETASAKGGTALLPEVTFFLPYPAYDTVAAAPLRPSTYRDNVLSSLHRGIDSAWPADYVINPNHGVLAFPAVVFLVGVLPAIFIRRARVWLAVWVVFWLGTLGPFLKLGAQKDTAEVFLLGDFVVRMPYALMFQFVPGMSRMFAPYRMASLVVVASVILVAISLDQLRRYPRMISAILVGAAIVVQPLYRFDLEDREMARPVMWRIPTQISSIKLPEFYARLNPDGWDGLIELPLQQQQDIICAYQSVHRRKVYRSWATSPAIPPWMRRVGGGDIGRRLRWLASPEPRRDPSRDVFMALSDNPLAADLSTWSEEDFAALRSSGDYRFLIVHERGYYLSDPRQGSVLYRAAVRKLEEHLGIEALEEVEIASFDWPGKQRYFPAGPAWVPWASHEVSMPTPDMPSQYFMSIFDLGEPSIPPEEPNNAEDSAEE